MLGILIAFIISWGILYLIEKKSILSLGVLPVPARLKQLLTGFLITGLLCVSVESLEMLLKGSSFHLNEDFDLSLFGNMTIWDLKSVITEELIFRGALLLILIERFGMKTGLLVSATAFGVYHWFSFGIIGNIFPMIIVFIGTALMGYAWALAFYKTKSIFMPIGLHLGWNFTFNTVFSKGPLGEGLLVAKGGSFINDWFSLIGLWGVPIIVLLVIKYLIPAQMNEQVEAKEKTTVNIS